MKNTKYFILLLLITSKITCSTTGEDSNVIIIVADQNITHEKHNDDSRIEKELADLEKTGKAKAVEVSISVPGMKKEIKNTSGGKKVIASYIVDKKEMNSPRSRDFEVSFRSSDFYLL